MVWAVHSIIISKNDMEDASMQGHACDLRAEEFHGSERADAILAFPLCSAKACPGLACMA